MKKLKKLRDCDNQLQEASEAFADSATNRKTLLSNVCVLQVLFTN